MKSQVTPRLLVAVFVTATLLWPPPAAAQKVSPSDLQFREAMRKQQAEGDLQSAIKLYQNIVDSKSVDRATKARALWEIAGCLEKLGQQAEHVYRQIVRDFGQQPEAKQAKDRLDALRPPAQPTTALRAIEFNSAIQNVVATDGRRAVYWGAANKLFIGDVRGREKRLVAQVKQRPERTVVSRDLSMVFLSFPASTALKLQPHYAVLKPIPPVTAS